MGNEVLNKEFKVLNITIEKLSLYYGFFLIAWGIIVSFVSGSSSATSYIPSFLGFPLVIFSYLAIKFSSKKKTVYAYCCNFWAHHFSRRIRFY